MSTAVVEGTEVKDETVAAPKKAKKSKSAVPMDVKLMARRFEPTVDTGTLKTPLKGLWTIEGQKGFYCFAGNLKPTATPEVSEGHVIANYDSSGTLAPAVFQRLEALEGVLVAQISG